jgi:hypothetical protein
MKKTTFTESVGRCRDRFFQHIQKGGAYALFLAFSLVWNMQSAEAQCSMACTNANIGIANNCIAYVSPMSVAKVHLGCNPLSWRIDIRETMNGPIIATGTMQNPAQVDGEVYLNRTLVAEVIDQQSGNKCWAFILIEDKTPPIIVCNDITLECDQMLTYTPRVTDNCEVTRVIQINESRRNGNCAPGSQERADGITSVVTRTYVAIDHVGLRDTCTVNISVRRPDMDLVECPDDEVTLSCSGTWERDQAGNPHPSETGYPTYNGVNLDPAGASLYCNLMVGYTDLNLSGFCQGERKIMRQWRVSEWYCGEDFDVVCTQVIVLKDTEAPSITCPAPSEVNTGFYTCASTLNIARPVVSDNCSPVNAIVVDLMFRDTFINNFQGGNINGFQVGQNVITFRAYDNCGNSTQCTQVITVVDRVSPIAICRSFTTASLGTEGTAQVPWSSFDDGSYDNCGIDRIEVRRMDGNVCDPQPVFRDYVPVCCLDVAAPVMVILQVYDKSNNSNTCMVALEVQDKLPATIVCPPSGQVECGFNLDDLSIFGTVVNQKLGETRNPVVINRQTWGLDGFAYDNCDVTITSTEDVDLTVCGAGQVTRTFNAVGAGNNIVATCTQIITVINDVNYLPQSIVWPCDIMVTNLCTTDPANDLSPDVLASANPAAIQVTACPNNRTTNQFYDRPRYNDDECTQVGVSFKDHVFEIQDSACYKIVREWKIIDWCAMEQNPGVPVTEFIYNHIQVIKIKNTVGPQIVCADDISVCSFQSNCSTGELLTASATATDDCTVAQDLFWRWEYFQNNGSIVTSTGNANTLTRNFPVGTHRVRFLVEDKCGNTAACTQLITVRDCKQPTPICHNLVIDLMITGMVNINAVLFNAGSNDNCTPQADLIYRIERTPFSAPGATPPQTAGTFATFTCDDLGINDVRIWVGDLDGNWDYCTTTLLVQNNLGANCLGNGGGIIAGRLKTENSEAVEKAEVVKEGQTMDMYMTGNEGMFQFENVAMGSNFAIKPKRMDNAANGVSTLDILKIQRHILGMEELGSPYKIIAADVNRSGVVTGADLVEMRRLILNTIEEYSNAPSWRFVPNNYQFFDARNPLAESFPEEVQIVNYQGNVPVLDFVAIKVGDVNESVKANSSSAQSAESRTARALILNVENQIIQAGNTYEVAFTSADFKNIFGYQFTLGFDASMLKLEDIKAGAIDVKDENFGFNYLSNGLISSSWNHNVAQSAGADDVLFTLVFTALNSGELNNALSIHSQVTQAEAYDNLEGETMGVQLAFNGTTEVAAAAAFELFQNRPNPFDNSTIISFNLPEAQSAQLTVYDLNGKVIHMMESSFNKGYNEVQLQASSLMGASGILYYELKTEGATAVKKMVRLN